MKLVPYNLVLRQMSWDLVQLADKFEDGLVPVDEAMVCIAAPMILVDFVFFTAKQLYIRHISALNVFYTDMRLERYRKLPYDEILKLLHEELPPMFEGREIARKLFFQDLKIVDSVTPDGFVVLNPTLADTYRKMQFKSLEYAEPKANSVKTKGKK